MLYSVLLLRPDYITGGEIDTYFTTAEGDTPQIAVDAVRHEAAACDDIGECDLTDYTVLLVIEGEHVALNHLVDEDRPMKAYQAHATGGFRAVADTPRGAAINFFTAFPTKRKCSIIEGEHTEGFFTITYGNVFPKSWNDVTKRNLDTLPDTLSGE